MNAIQAVSPDDQNVVEFAESPGRRLRLQRQSKGWEIERVATQLHLRTQMVEAIEQDRFDDLPGPVFAMGYLRNYARLVDLPPEPLIDAYRATHPSEEPVVPWIRAGSSPKPEIGSGHILVRLISVGLLLAVVGLLVLWWQNRPEPFPEPSMGLDSPGLPVLPPDEPMGDTLDLEDPGIGDAPPDATESGADTKALALPPPPDADDLDSGTTSPLTLPSASGSVPTETEQSSPPRAEPETASTAPETGEETVAQTEAPVVPEVVLKFTGTSWIDVRDASGKSVLTGEMHKGDRRVLKGTPPYSLVIGNSAAAAITVGDKTLDLSTRGRSGVARFTLDPSKPQ